MLSLVDALTKTRTFTSANETDNLFGGAKEAAEVTLVHNSTAGGDIVAGLGSNLKSKGQGVVLPTGAPGVTFFVPAGEYLSAFLTAAGEHDVSVIARPARCKCGP